MTRFAGVSVSQDQRGRQEIRWSSMLLEMTRCCTYRTDSIKFTTTLCKIKRWVIVIVLRRSENKNGQEQMKIINEIHPTTRQQRSTSSQSRHRRQSQGQLQQLSQPRFLCWAGLLRRLCGMDPHESASSDGTQAEIAMATQSSLQHFSAADNLNTVLLAQLADRCCSHSPQRGVTFQNQTRNRDCLSKTCFSDRATTL